MKRTLLLSVQQCLLLLAFVVASGQLMADSRPLVFVSIVPQKYFVEQISGGMVDVEVMVGTGQNPTTYEPTPRQIAAITRTSIYFSIGVPFERAWLNRVGKNNPDMKVVLCCDGIIDNQSHDMIHEHADGSAHDPHVWTSPKNVKLVARQIAEELSALDSDNALHYQQMAQQFIERLSELDYYIRDMTQDLMKRTMIVSHPSWSYFAEEYGFVQISIEQNGKEIKAASLRDLIEIAKKENIRAVFAQPQFNNKAAYIIAKELGASVYSLDPLAYDYINNMKATTDKIVAGLSHE